MVEPDIWNGVISGIQVDEFISRAYADGSEVMMEQAPEE